MHLNLSLKEKRLWCSSINSVPCWSRISLDGWKLTIPAVLCSTCTWAKWSSNHLGKVLRQKAGRPGPACLRKQAGNKRRAEERR